MKKQHFEQVSRMLQELVEKYEEDKETVRILEHVAAILALSMLEALNQSPNNH